MYQIDNSTAVAAQPASTSLGTVGYFTDGNPATGVSATIMPAEFMNAVMVENLNVLAAAGITPAKNQFNQLALAIAKIVQNGAAGAASETSAGILKLATSVLAAAGVDNTTAITPQKLAAQIQAGGLAFGVDTGTANTYVCTFSPTLTARVEGQVLRFKVKTANTGASTINDGVGVVPLVGGAHAALQGGELFPNGDAWIQWNTSVGAGSYILLFCTGAPEQVAPATQSQHAVTAGQIQTQGLTAFTTGGTAPAFTLTPTPAITAYAANQRFQVTFNAAGTTPTLNVSGLGAKNLKQYTAAGAKIAAIIASGQTSDVVYDGTDLVVLDQLPNTVGVTAAQFDNSTNLATTSFVEGVGLQFSSLALATASITLTAATHAGALIVGNSASAINVTLPAAATMPAKTVIKLWNFNSGAITIVCAGSDAIYSPSGGTTFPVPQGAYVTLASNGTAAWFAIENSTQGVTPAQFNGSTALATTAFVQGVGFQFSGIFTPTANTTLTAATHAGSVIIANSASLLTITLPASSTMPAKTVIKFLSYGAGGMSVTAAGSDSIYLPATNTTFSVPQGAWVTLVSNGASGWYAVDMSGLGVGQTWQNLGASRVAGTTYTNSTGRPIMLTVSVTSSNSQSFSVLVGGVNMATSNSGGVNYSQVGCISVIIPNLSTYSVSLSTGGVSSWFELR